MAQADFRKYHIEKLRSTDEAVIYLEIALQEYEKDGDTEAFLVALRDVAEAQGGMTKLSKKTSLSRTSIYKTLSANGNPKINTICAILRGLGFRIRLEPLYNSKRRAIKKFSHRH